MLATSVDAGASAEARKVSRLPIGVVKQSLGNESERFGEVFWVSMMRRSGAYQCELLELTENSRLRRLDVDDPNQSRSACV